MCSDEPQERRARDLLSRLIRRVGRRGFFLLILGVVFILRGEALTEDLPLTVLGEEMLAHAFRLFPSVVWGSLFLIAGVIACSSAFIHTRDRRYSDAAGFAALQGVAMAWATSMWAAAISGSDTAIRAGLTWTMVVAAIALVAGWEEAPR